MSRLVRPHGGQALRPLLLSGKELAAERERAQTLPQLPVSSRERGDLIMLGIGGFTPLDGFMTHADWKGVCDGYRLANGLFWPIPITLSADSAAASRIAVGADVALVDAEGGEVVATMTVTEKYAIDKAHECSSVFRTTDAAHPGVRMVMQQPEVNLAGPVRVLSDGGFKAKYGALFMTPAETRAEFERLGWSQVAAFQTRNPMHRSHEYLAKVAIETCDGVLVHSLLGALKPGDIPADVRTRAIGKLIEKYFVPEGKGQPRFREMVVEAAVRSAVRAGIRTADLAPGLDAASARAAGLTLVGTREATDAIVERVLDTPVRGPR